MSCPRCGCEDTQLQKSGSWWGSRSTSAMTQSRETCNHCGLVFSGESQTSSENHEDYEGHFPMPVCKECGGKMYVRGTESHLKEQDITRVECRNCGRKAKLKKKEVPV